MCKHIDYNNYLEIRQMINNKPVNKGKFDKKDIIHIKSLSSIELRNINKPIIMVSKDLLEFLEKFN